MNTPLSTLPKVIALTAFLSFVFQIYCTGQSTDRPLIYEQDFRDLESWDEFDFSDKEAWRIDNGALELFEASDYSPPVRSPKNIALIKDMVVGSFTLEVNLAQTSKEYGHRDLCLFFGVRDASNFYYVHLATKADDHANNIFLVNDEPRIKIATQTSTGTDWGQQGSWHKVRIVRATETGTIEVYFDDMEVPVMKAEDLHFTEGLVGFGSFDDTGTFDNIKIWGEQLAPPKSFFK